jgi:hypothetical protein
MLTVVHAVPMAWQLAQVLLVIGAVVCALVPLVGFPALGVTASGIPWHPDCAQLVATVTPFAA